VNVPLIPINPSQIEHELKLAFPTGSTASNSLASTTTTATTATTSPVTKDHSTFNYPLVLSQSTYVPSLICRITTDPNHLCVYGSSPLASTPDVPSSNSGASSAPTSGQSSQGSQGTLQKLETPATAVSHPEFCGQLYTELVESGIYHNHCVCVVCRVAKPLRSKHCRRCDRCVYRFDHHCPWVDNCVGAANYHHFFAFITLGTVMSLLYVVLATLHFIQSDFTAIFSVINAVHAFVMALFVTSLWGSHVYFVVSDISTMEQMMNDQFREKTTFIGNIYTFLKGYHNQTLRFLRVKLPTPVLESYAVSVDSRDPMQIYVVPLPPPALDTVSHNAVAHSLNPFPEQMKEHQKQNQNLNGTQGQAHGQGQLQDEFSTMQTPYVNEHGAISYPKHMLRKYPFGTGPGHHHGGHNHSHGQNHNHSHAHGNEPCHGHH